MLLCSPGFSASVEPLPYLEKCWNRYSSFHRHPLTGKMWKLCFSFTETSGRDKPQRGSGGGHLLHSSPGGVHRNATDKCNFFSFFWIPLPVDWVTFNILIWCCQVPNCDGKFLLRILTDEQSNIWWAWQDNEIKSWLFRLFDKRDNGQIGDDLLWILGRWTKTMSWSEMFSWNSKTVSNMWVLSSPRIHNTRTFWLVVMSNEAALVYGTDSTGSLGNSPQLVYIFFVLKSGRETLPSKKESVGSWYAMHDSFSSSSSSQASYLDDSEGSSSRHKFSSKFNHKVSLYSISIS